MYEEIADELNVPDSVIESAEKSYKAVGECLTKHIPQYEIDVFPQGSMNLGTLVKPISDEDDYDLDAVCKIKSNISSPEKLKNLIGDVLKNSDRYSPMLQEEGKRCWTLKYADDRRFHMDILPAIPNASQTNSSIKITHKDESGYKFMISNPEGYADWFNKLQEKTRMKLFESKGVKYSSSVEDLRKYKVRTPLQQAIQILKRHRDIKYKDVSNEERENKPISIIITTLVGKMYTGEENIVQLIMKFVNDYDKYIEIDSYGNYVIKNPVNEKENFADKWIIYPERKRAFFDWVRTLKYDLITNNFMCFDDVLDKNIHLKDIFGESVINSVFEKRSSAGLNKYIDRNGIATLTSHKTDTKIKEHNFYGE